MHTNALNFANQLPQRCAVLCLVTQWWLTLCDPMDCSPPGSCVHGDSLGKSAGVGSLCLLQGIFLTWELIQGLLHLPVDSSLAELPGKPRATSSERLFIKCLTMHSMNLHLSFLWHAIPKSLPTVTPPLTYFYGYFSSWNNFCTVASTLKKCKTFWNCWALFLSQ